MKTPSLEDLMIGPNPIEIPVAGDRKLTFYIRRLSQIERDMCTASARRVSKDLRRELEDPKSEKRTLLVDDEINEYDEDALRTAWINTRLVKRALTMQRASLEARDETYVPEPEGDDVTPGEIEAYEIEVEDVEADREDNIRKAIETARKELVEESKKLTHDELLVAATPAQIDAICADAWTTEYVAQLISRGTFLDKHHTKPAFKTAMEVKRLQPHAIDLLSKAHMNLLVDPEAVKN